jgi:hypothetical protein
MPEAIPAVAPLDEIHEEDRPWLLLAYAGPLAGLPLSSRSVPKYIKFHARQGLGLFILFCALSVVALMPWIGPALWLVGALMYLAGSAGGLFYAFKGRRRVIPFATLPLDFINEKILRRSKEPPPSVIR